MKNLKQRIKEVSHADGYSVEVSDVFDVIDAVLPEVIKAMELLKLGKDLDIIYPAWEQINDTVSQCQRLVKYLLEES